MLKEYILKINWDREIDGEILQNNLDEIKDFIKNNCYCTGVRIIEDTPENRQKEEERKRKITEFCKELNEEIWKK